MKIEAPRGTHDVLPDEQPVRDRILTATKSLAARYGYGRIDTPMFEDTQLFARTSGEGSDVVTKEMYTFEDRSGRSLTLRPEATAPVARAYVEHGLHRRPQPVKTFYSGQMFRYAAPQKGRFREFWQIGFEAMGSDDPAIDAELIQLFVELADEAGIEGLRLDLNSIGDRKTREEYTERLLDYLRDRRSELDDDARQKLETSPLRVFDSKAPSVQAALSGAPKIGESLTPESVEHFKEVRACLDAYGVAYDLQPTLVRGLDYYTHTVWEFVSERLEAAQSTVCAGGRYDYLIEEIGGPSTPGVGWAAGVERLVMSMSGEPERLPIDVFVAFDDRSRRHEFLSTVAQLRSAGKRCEVDYAGRSLKGQLTHAGRLGARAVVIVRGDGLTVRRQGEEDVDVADSEEVFRLLVA